MVKPSIVFKILGWTMVIMVLSNAIIEMTNVRLNAAMLPHLVSRAIETSCELFGQETYKRDDFVGVNMPNIVGVDGTTIYGEFYDGATPRAIYDSLFTDNVDFYKAIHDERRFDSWGAGREWGTYTRGSTNFYTENMITPLNIGITYLDIPTVTKISKWGLGTLLTNGAKDESGRYTNLRRDELNRQYINYKGFNIYVDELTIPRIVYTECDLSTNNGRALFESKTNMDADRLYDNLGASDERKFVMLAEVEFRVPVSYSGITALGKIATHLWSTNTVVRGYDGIDGNMHHHDGAVYDNTVRDTLQGGTASGRGDGVWSRTNAVLYYVIR